MNRLYSLMATGALIWTLIGVDGTGHNAALAAAACTTGFTLSLHPGLPASMKQHLPIASDIPRAPVSVSAPLYPGSVPLTQFVASPIAEYPASPYLQTGVAEYRTPATPATVTSWYRTALTACGWRANGTMQTNASLLTTGISFVAIGNPNLTLDMTFGDAPGGGTYVAYAAEDITYAPRPAASYLHGPFSAVNIVLRRATIQNGQPVWHLVHATVSVRPFIRGLVAAINAIRDRFTVSGVCSGGGSLTGPAWLSFVRPNGTIVHAFERGPGVCGSGLAVNGVRWLIDQGAVWNLITREARSVTGGSPTRILRSIPRLMSVRDVSVLCSRQPGSHFDASVHGFLSAFPLLGPGGGWVGRLFSTPNPRAFYAGDTKPFVQVWGTKAWSLNLNGHNVTFHGVLACDSMTYMGDLPGWQGSLTPDRYTVLPAPARTHLYAEDRASVVSHGLRVALRVPRNSYPRNALIRATLSILNTTGHTIGVMSGLKAPEVDVLTASGKQVYEPINALGDLTIFLPNGPGPESFRVSPHGVYTVHEYVVLRGTTLVARVTLGDTSSNVPLVSINGPRLTLRLTSEPSPQVDISASPLKVRVISPYAESTSAVSFSQAQCDNGIVSTGWVTTHNGFIDPDVGTSCTPAVWHAIAGWLNHPVAAISYTSTRGMVNVFTTPPSRLQPADASFPASGVCARAMGSQARIQLNRSLASPRCEVVTSRQRLLVVNNTAAAVHVRLGHTSVVLERRQSLTIDQPFGTYLAPGVHFLHIPPYGGSVELWLRG